jgi:hypothetical protein
MYFFYLDESGEKNPAVKKEEPFVLLALSLHESRWKRFESSINKVKLELINKIQIRSEAKLDLADAEVKSSDIRIPNNRNRNKFLKELTDVELLRISDTYYEQFSINYIKIFVSVIDKQRLEDFMDIEKLLKKSYEMIIERADMFINNEHYKNHGIFILDNTTKQLNRLVAMKHSYFLREGTTSG